MSLLFDLESTTGKIALQKYTVKHGIETFEILVPVANVLVFEEQMRQPLKSKADVLKIVFANAGELN
jgi:hypothetical protein